MTAKKTTTRTRKKVEPVVQQAEVVKVEDAGAISPTQNAIDVTLTNHPTSDFGVRIITDVDGEILLNGVAKFIRGFFH